MCQEETLRALFTRGLAKPHDGLTIARHQLCLDLGSFTQSDFGADPPDFRFLLPVHGGKQTSSKPVGTSHLCQFPTHAPQNLRPFTVPGAIFHISFRRPTICALACGLAKLSRGYPSVAAWIPALLGLAAPLADSEGTALWKPRRDAGVIATGQS